LLSGGERFTLRDLVTGPELTKPRLVVLSACQTAITEFNVLPEEAIGLPSGFLQAGLPGVVGSLWPVQEISTALLMIQFYRYHLHGDPPNQVPPLSPMRALRKAQLWLRDLTNAQLADIFHSYRKAAVHRAGGIPLELAQSQFQNFALGPTKERPYSHPYYWAAFAYFGI
jgi:CHAT domain-containing protein